MEFRYTDMLALLGVGGAHPGGLHLTKQMLEEEHISSDTLILDAGCGTGQTAAYLFWEYGCSVRACDINQTMIQKANRRFESLDLPITAVPGSIEQLPFASGLFDMVLLESVASFTDISLTLAECYRVLKPGGKLFAVEIVKNPGLPLRDEQIIKEFYGFHTILTKEQWLDSLARQGFSQVTADVGCKTADEEDVDFGTEFDLSEQVDPRVYNILDRHDQLTEQYADVIGFSVFRGIR